MHQFNDTLICMRYALVRPTGGGRIGQVPRCRTYGPAGGCGVSTGGGGEARWPWSQAAPGVRPTDMQNTCKLAATSYVVPSRAETL